MTAYVSPWTKAIIYAGIGDKENSLKYLEGAYKERSSLAGMAEPRSPLGSVAQRPAFPGFNAACRIWHLESGALWLRRCSYGQEQRASQWFAVLFPVSDCYSLAHPRSGLMPLR
jgi:hypothetical protein